MAGDYHMFQKIQELARLTTDKLFPVVSRKEALQIMKVPISPDPRHLGPVSQAEADFRIKHYGHTLILKSIPNGIGSALQIRCENCKTRYLDVIDLDTW